MLFMTTSMTAIMLLSMTIMLLSTLLAKKTFKDREKNSPFECGFDPKTSARLPFSLRFFLIAVIFLIFDVEVTLLLPIPIAMELISLDKILLTAIIFFLILLVGLYHEWAQGSLDWSE